MSRLQIGSRVRVKRTSRLPAYQPGDKGTVTGEGRVPRGAEPTYLVAMDKNGPMSTSVLFAAHEIEADE